MNYEYRPTRGVGSIPEPWNGLDLELDIFYLAEESFLIILPIGIFTEPAHIFGFWDNYPDTEKWTDAELGIPADDE